MAYEAEIAICVTILMLIVVVIVIALSMQVIQPWEQGLNLRLGTYLGKLEPGLHLVAPLISHVVHVDLRTQKLDIPMQEIELKNHVRVKVDAIIYIRVIDPVKSYFEVNNPRVAITALASTVISTCLSDMNAMDIAIDRKGVILRLRDILDEATDKWGVKVESIELGRFEAEGKDLWKELARPAPIMQLKLRSRTPLEEAATLQLMAAKALMEKLEWDHRDISSLKEKLDGAQKALESGDHEGALRIALGVTERGLENN